MSESAAPSTPASQAPATPTSNTPDNKGQAQSTTTQNTATPTLAAVQDANPDLSKAEAKKMLKELTIKFNDKDIVEKLPFEIPDEPEAIEYMRQKLQMGKLATSKSQETSQLKKDVESFFKALQGDTKQVLREMGLDPKKLSEQWIEEELKEMEKSPEQKEKEQLQKELQEMKDKFKTEEEAKKAADISRMQEKFAMDLDRDITDSLTNSKLPKSPYVVKRIAEGLLLAHKKGFNKATAKDIVPLIEKDILGEIQSMLGAAPEDAMEAILGKQNIEKLRKRRVSKAVGSASGIKPTGNEVRAANEPAKKTLTIKDYFRK